MGNGVAGQAAKSGKHALLPWSCVPHLYQFPTPITSFPRRRESRNGKGSTTPCGPSGLMAPHGLVKRQRRAITEPGSQDRAGVTGLHQFPAPIASFPRRRESRATLRHQRLLPRRATSALPASRGTPPQGHTPRASGRRGNPAARCSRCRGTNRARARR